MLEIKNLNKSFNNQELLNDISFSLNKGEIGVLLGKSGAGKTTLLRCICGLEEFDSGEIIFNDKVFRTSKDILKIKGIIGMVFQNFNLFPHLSVIENITTAPIKVLNQDIQKAEQIAINLLKLFDLEDKINAYPFELSGGQKQRVAIARACALSPDIICFDEPTSALDSNSIENVVNIIKKLKEQNVTVLIVTHDIKFANMISDKTICIKDGSIENIIY